MMKILRVGDPHVKVSNIDEWDLLISFIAETALKHKVDRIELLGDLFHTHAILRLEVLEFWKYALEHLSDICELVVLVGNHDMSGDYNSSNSALDIFSLIRKKNLHIINTARVLGVYGYVPYIHSNSRFLEIANGLVQYGAKLLVSHTTYNGSKFESGIFAPDGVDPEALDFPLLISGHIHARQRFFTNKGQQVIYPGTCRWDTDSDANQPKGLWLVEHGSNGEIITEEFIDTSSVAVPIVKLDFKEGDAMPGLPPNAKTTINLIGTSEWVTAQKQFLKGKFSLTSKITDKGKLENRKVGKGITDFVSNIFPTKLDKQRLLKFMQERGLV